MVLEKTLESPLDCKEIQPVHPKGDQSRVFIGRTDAKAETPVRWPLMRRVDSLEKTLMLGGTGGRRRRGRQTYFNEQFNKLNQIRSVAQSCPTLCDSMNHSTPGLPVPHQLPEFTQTHVHRVSDAIQPSHPLSSPSPPAPSPSQHQGLFQ